MTISHAQEASDTSDWKKFKWESIYCQFIDPTANVLTIKPSLNKETYNHAEKIEENIKKSLEEFIPKSHDACLLFIDPKTINPNLFKQYIKEFIMICIQEKIPYQIALSYKNDEINYILNFLAPDSADVLNIKDWDNIYFDHGYKTQKYYTSIDELLTYLKKDMPDGGNVIINMSDAAFKDPEKFAKLINYLNSRINANIGKRSFSYINYNVYFRL